MIPSKPYGHCWPRIHAFTILSTSDQAFFRTPRTKPCFYSFRSPYLWLKVQSRSFGQPRRRFLNGPNSLPSHRGPGQCLTDEHGLSARRKKMSRSWTVWRNSPSDSATSARPTRDFVQEITRSTFLKPSGVSLGFPLLAENKLVAITRSPKRCLCATNLLC